DVEEIPTHGGSLRIYAKHKEDDTKLVTHNVTVLLGKENNKGMLSLAYYNNFQQKALQVKLDLISFLIEQKRAGRKIAAYGAAAKGNTLLNYCGIKKDLIDYVVDANPHKQGKCLPASHIPVVSESLLRTNRPDYIVILPWNLKKEITDQLSYVREWNGKFVIPVPKLEVIQ
ncbi:MAG: SAM-dependent methyltransferase, partial [Bacteroidetes bacterium]